MKRFWESQFDVILIDLRLDTQYATERLSIGQINLHLCSREEKTSTDGLLMTRTT